MVLLKSFIRYKSTKIFLVIFTTLLITITILFNFINYYSNIVTKTYQENSYFLIISDKNNYNKIKEKEYVANLETAILFKPDYENNFLDNHDIVWQNLFDLNNDFIVAIPNDDDFKLSNDQIAFGIPKKILRNIDSIHDLENQKAFFIVDDNKVAFDLKSISESIFSRALISPETFQKLLDVRNSYSYTFVINDYEQIKYIVDSLNKIEGVQEVIFNQTYESEASFNTVEKLKNIISILNFVSKVIVIVVSILFIIVTKNIINDEIENMSLERLVGYNKYQVKKFLIMKMLIFNLSVIICSIIGYIFINLLIINFLRIKINLFDSVLLITIFSIQLFVSLGFCLLSQINDKKSNIMDTKA